MPKFDSFGWGELISLIAVIISFVTIYTSINSRTKADIRHEQATSDKLDRLFDMSKETNETVKSMNKKIDDHAERLARLESDNEAVFRRLKRIEETQDHCQACRTAKQDLLANQG